jgi:mercuric ion transport protein
MTERTWKQNLLAVPGIGLSLLPKVACPACWPAYAGLLSSLGLGFLISTAYLLPMTAAFLLLAVGMLGFRARRRRGYVPFALGIFAASFILFGKFSSASNPVLYAGLGLLIVASAWNGWPTTSRCICAPAAEKFHGLGALKEK